MWFAVFGGTDVEVEAEVLKIRDLDLAIDAGEAWLALWKTRLGMEDYLRSCIDGGYRFVPDMIGRMNLFITACKKQKAALVPVPPPSTLSTMLPTVTGAAVYHSKAVADDTADHTTPPFKYVGHSSKAAGGKKVSGERVFSSTFFGRIPEDGGKIAYEMSKDVSALILLYFKASRGFKRESGYPAIYVPYPTALWTHHYGGAYDVISKLLVAAINRLVVERGETTPVGDAWQNESKSEGAAKLSKFFIENAPQFGELGASPIEQLGGKQVATIPYWFFEVPLTNDPYENWNQAMFTSGIKLRYHVENHEVVRRWKTDHPLWPTDPNRAPKSDFIDDMSKTLIADEQQLLAAWENWIVATVWGGLKLAGWTLGKKDGESSTTVASTVKAPTSFALAFDPTLYKM